MILLQIFVVWGFSAIQIAIGAFEFMSLKHRSVQWVMPWPKMKLHLSKIRKENNFERTVLENTEIWKVGKRKHRTETQTGVINCRKFESQLKA